MVAAVVVNGGFDCCCVGFLPEKYLPHAEKLEGRVAQVIELLCDSSSSAARQHSRLHGGVIRCVLIDNFNETDKIFEGELSDVEMDSDEED